VPRGAVPVLPSRKRGEQRDAAADIAARIVRGNGNPQGAKGKKPHDDESFLVFLVSWF
jgi:hypothetical protein